MSFFPESEVFSLFARTVVNTLQEFGGHPQDLQNICEEQWLIDQIAAIIRKRQFLPSGRCILPVEVDYTQKLMQAIEDSELEFYADDFLEDEDDPKMWEENDDNGNFPDAREYDKDAYLLQRLEPVPGSRPVYGYEKKMVEIHLIFPHYPYLA